MPAEESFTSIGANDMQQVPVAASVESANGVSINAPPPTQEGRILAALGMIRGPLPRAVTKWLVRYYEYLSARLQLPFEARCPEGTGVIRPWTSSVTVVELVAPTEISAFDGLGLLCRVMREGVETEIPLVDLELSESHPNAQLIEDYWYWFWNWQFDPKI